jgi:2-polyprenyl-3-methyl-5-hydroxy-6-metoxy-1,4-benzoquinol methylase
VFLFVFDFASYFERKNPLATIQAFCRAFSYDDDVRLVIKCVNEQLDSEAFDSMQTLAGQHQVSVQTGYWTAEEMRDLMMACDAYISLHRSEGLGLPIADAMALGKPVIATAWSGNTDFMTVSNSFPVPYELVTLKHDAGPYRAGATWAEPSVDEAVRLMRLVRDDPELAHARGQAARHDLETEYSEQKVGERVVERLAIAVGRQRVNGTETRVQVIQPAAPSALPVPSVPPMDLSDSSHGRFGVLVKRAMNFMLRYHTHYQGEINLAFARFMRQLQADTEAQAAQVARLNRQLAARPYMAYDAYGSAGDLSEPMGFGLDERAAASPTKAPEFADLFRGPEGFIANRQRVYLQFLKGLSSSLSLGKTHIVDLGSGRGEFLELLGDEGIEAIGVELDPVLVERCTQRGLRVQLADAFEYLKGIPEDSVDAIFSAQFIEHVKSDRLAELVEAAYSRLRQKGLFIAETVNPESYVAMKTFYVDLSHQRPIYPQVLLHLCQTAGFRSARIFYPTAGGATQTAYRDASEYAVIAVK